MLPDEQASPEQIATLRALTGAERLRLAERLYWSARKLKAAGLRHQHPDWPEERVNDEVRRIFTNARTRPVFAVRTPAEPRRHPLCGERQCGRNFLRRTPPHA